MSVNERTQSTEHTTGRPADAAGERADLLASLGRQRHFLRFTTRDLTDATWSELRAAYDERTVIEILLLVGHYDMLATTLTTLRLEPDPPAR